MKILGYDLPYFNFYIWLYDDKIKLTSLLNKKDMIEFFFQLKQLFKWVARKVEDLSFFFIYIYILFFKRKWH